jgi:hypothetical protein
MPSGKWDKALRELAQACVNATIGVYSPQDKDRAVEAVLRERLGPHFDLMERVIEYIRHNETYQEAKEELAKWTI